jgi:hypothetical protein
MKQLLRPWLFLLLAPVVSAAGANFSGTWVVNPGRGQNMGMMANLKLTVTLEQTDKMLTSTDISSMQGQEQRRVVTYDLTGKAVPNAGPMGDKSQTVSKWDGNTLITTWTSEGAIAGSQVVRTETRSLSADGRTMTVETVRGSSPPVVMVFEKR